MKLKFAQEVRKEADEAKAKNGLAAIAREIEATKDMGQYWCLVPVEAIGQDAPDGKWQLSDPAIAEMLGKYGYRLSHKENGALIISWRD